jgi:hypothetical protein
MVGSPGFSQAKCTSRGAAVNSDEGRRTRAILNSGRSIRMGGDIELIKRHLNLVEA